MTSTDALILDLSTDLAPVKRRRTSREALVLASVGLMELALILGAGGMRPDMGRVITSPFMIWKIGSLAVLAGVTCAIALRSFAPPGTRRRALRMAATIIAPVAIAGVFVTPAADAGRSLIERLSPVHGLLCATSVIVLATPMVAALGILMRRAAPVRPAESAFASGLAAASCGALVFTICCPMNDPLYIMVWYSLAVAAVAFVARWLLPRNLRL